MQYRRLGSTGLQLSALSYGAWVTFGNQLGRGEARELIAQCVDAGINFFDNAETYANGEAERIMGDVLVDLRLPRDGLDHVDENALGPSVGLEPDLGHVLVDPDAQAQRGGGRELADALLLERVDDLADRRLRRRRDELALVRRHHVTHRAQAR